MVFALIRDRLAGASHVIVLPDGKRNLVLFKALIDPQAERLATQMALMGIVAPVDAGQ